MFKVSIERPSSLVAKEAFTLGEALSDAVEANGGDRLSNAFDAALLCTVVCDDILDGFADPSPALSKAVIEAKSVLRNLIDVLDQEYSVYIGDDRSAIAADMCRE